MGLFLRPHIQTVAIKAPALRRKVNPPVKIKSQSVAMITPAAIPLPWAMKINILLYIVQSSLRDFVPSQL